MYEMSARGYGNPRLILVKKFIVFSLFSKSEHSEVCNLNRPQRINYSHWAHGAQNGVISIGQWGVFNHEKGAI